MPDVFLHGVPDYDGEHWSCNCGEEYSTREAAAAAAPACFAEPHGHGLPISGTFETCRGVWGPLKLDLEHVLEEAEVDLDEVIDVVSHRMPGDWSDAFVNAVDELENNDLRARIERAIGEWVEAHDLNNILHLEDTETHQLPAPGVPDAG